MDHFPRTLSNNFPKKPRDPEALLAFPSPCPSPPLRSPPLLFHPIPSAPLLCPPYPPHSDFQVCWVSGLLVVGYEGEMLLGRRLGVRMLRRYACVVGGDEVGEGLGGGGRGVGGREVGEGWLVGAGGGGVDTLGVGWERGGSG